MGPPAVTSIRAHRKSVDRCGLTDVEVDIEVTDIRADQTVLYSNTLGQPFQLVRDTTSFTTCP